jgi:hypothetical protein
MATTPPVNAWALPLSSAAASDCKYIPFTRFRKCSTLIWFQTRSTVLANVKNAAITGTYGSRFTD